jgi:hypothetical protein
MVYGTLPKKDKEIVPLQNKRIGKSVRQSHRESIASPEIQSTNLNTGEKSSHHLLVTSDESELPITISHDNYMSQTGLLPKLTGKGGVI